MTAQSLNPPPYQQPLADRTGRLSSQWSWWISQVYDRLGGTVDKLNAADETAQAAVPQTTEVVAGGGLQIGGALGGNISLSLYKVKTNVAALPTSGNAEGDWAYALDGRKSGETAGNGTGVPVWWSSAGGVSGWYTGAGGQVLS